MVIKVTASLKLTPTDLEPILSGFYDGLADDPPVLRVNCRRAGTLYWDYHSSATAPSIGGGNIATGSQAVIGGPNIVKLALTGGTGPGYIHLRCQSADGVSNPLVTQEITVPSAFDPSDLFANGEKGGFWDISPATTYLDSYRSTAASVDGLVGFVNDSSGNGNHMRQTTSGARPYLRQSGSLYYLEYDTTDDEHNVVLDLDQTDELTMFCLYDVLTYENQSIFGINELTYNFRLGSGGGENDKFISVKMADGTQRVASATASPLTEPICHIGEAKISTNHAKCYANGQTGTQSTTFGSGSNFGTGLTVHMPYAGSSGNNLRGYASLIINRLLTAGEITSLQNWAKTKGNITW